MNDIQENLVKILKNHLSSLTNANLYSHQSLSPNSIVFRYEKDYGSDLRDGESLILRTQIDRFEESDGKNCIIVRLKYVRNNKGEFAYRNIVVSNLDYSKILLGRDFYENISFCHEYLIIPELNDDQTFKTVVSKLFKNYTPFKWMMRNNSNKLKFIEIVKELSFGVDTSISPNILDFLCHLRSGTCDFYGDASGRSLMVDGFEIIDIEIPIDFLNEKFEKISTKKAYLIERNEKKDIVFFIELEDGSRYLGYKNHPSKDSVFILTDGQVMEKYSGIVYEKI